MRTDDSTDASVASWAQLEQSIERLHGAARAALSVREFYPQLLAEAAAPLAASGGAAWLDAAGGPELLLQWRGSGDGAAAKRSSARREQIQRAFRARSAFVLDDGIDAGGAGSDPDAGATVLCPVRRPGVPDLPTVAENVALIELRLPAGATPIVQQGWLDYAATLAEIAADFHALEELRRLRSGGELQRQAVDLMRRVGRPRTLAGAAFEIANEGRRILDCDRLSVVLRRSTGWRLTSTSGVDRVARRTDFARLTERLADGAARWGEPITATGDRSDEVALPPQLAATVTQHVDHSQAQAMACAPMVLAGSEDPSAEDQPPRRHRKRRADVVLVAECFEARSEAELRDQLVELGELCRPALARVAEIDRFPVRSVLRWSERLALFRRPAWLMRRLAVAGAMAAVVAALVLAPAELAVEAPATLVAAVERDVFATATGSVAEVRVEHGQRVAAGEVLAVLHDPELLLKLQQTRGEIETAQKRLDALAIARTERTLRANESDDRLPLSAEQRQLEARLASLESERKLLEKRREALTLRSPIAGEVLTRDVQKLLQSRPVERGQALVTVANLSQGWQLVAEASQRQISHVLDAQRDGGSPTVQYRLAGDLKQSYEARVESIDAAAALEPAGLQDEPPPVEVRIAVSGQPPPAARPGMTATVRIDCGKRSLGYVWLHDAWATLYRWATF